MARKPRGDSPHYVDLHVGQRIRGRRKAARLSLEGLAAQLEITHQQLQKYETGANRMSIVMLFQIAGALRASPAWFLEGLPNAETVADLGARERDLLQRFLASPGGGDLMRAFVALPPHLQHPLVAMAKASVNVEHAPEGG